MVWCVILFDVEVDNVIDGCVMVFGVCVGVMVWCGMLLMMCCVLLCVFVVMCGVCVMMMCVVCCEFDVDVVMCEVCDDDVMGDDVMMMS